MTGRLARNAVLSVLVLIIAVALAEGLLRIIGLKPWSYQTADVNEPKMHEPHPVLGWRNKSGNYIVPPYHSSGDTVRITFLENGSRRTAEISPYDTEGEIVVVGGSYTQGWAINDDETYAWKLQEQYSSLKVLNYGTGGYGSYQSLLVLERELPRMTSPRFVLYGFLGHHESRNVATNRWLRTLASFSRRDQVIVPFATYDEKNGLTRHPPARYFLLPFSESSALINLISRAYGRFLARKRYSQLRTVTEEILLQMNTVSEKYGAAFFVVFLQTDDSNQDHYIEFLNENNIRFIDCSYRLSDEMMVPGEGHPNGKMNTLWARCIQSQLDKQIGTGPGP